MTARRHDDDLDVKLHPGKAASGRPTGRCPDSSRQRLDFEDPGGVGGGGGGRPGPEERYYGGQITRRVAVATREESPNFVGCRFLCTPSTSLKKKNQKLPFGHRAPRSSVP